MIIVRDRSLVSKRIRCSTGGSNARSGRGFIVSRTFLAVFDNKPLGKIKLQTS
jgi:hypothetical protein